MLVINGRKINDWSTASKISDLKRYFFCGTTGLGLILFLILFSPLWFLGRLHGFDPVDELIHGPLLIPPLGHHVKIEYVRYRVSIGKMQTAGARKIAGLL